MRPLHRIEQTISLRFLYLILVFLLLTISWLFYHELAHFYICELSGLKGKITFDKTIAMTTCENIDNSTFINKFSYIMAPYFVDSIVLLPVFWLLYIKKLNIRDSVIRVLPYVITVDIGYNYFSSLFETTDFVLAFSLLGKYWYSSVVFVITILIGTILLIKRDIISFIRYVKR